MIFTGKITIYNSVERDFKKILIPKLLNGVHVEIQRGANKAADGDKNADSLFAIIPFKPFKSGFKEPFEYNWDAGQWTLAAGDIIAVGDTGAAENFAELTARAAAFRIVSVKGFDFGSIPHWEVTAQ